MQENQEALYHIVILNEELQLVLRKIIFCHLHTKIKVTVGMINSGICTKDSKNGQYDIETVNSVIDKSFIEYSNMTKTLVSYLKEESATHLFYFNSAMITRVITIIKSFNESSATKLLNDEEAMLLAKHYTELLEKFEQSALYQFTKAEVKEAYKNA